MMMPSRVWEGRESNRSPCQDFTHVCLIYTAWGEATAFIHSDTHYGTTHTRRAFLRPHYTVIIREVTHYLVSREIHPLAPLMARYQTAQRILLHRLSRLAYHGTHRLSRQHLILHGQQLRYLNGNLIYLRFTKMIHIVIVLLIRQSRTSLSVPPPSPPQWPFS